MIASERRKRSILYCYKYPHEDEAKAKILYYREARDRISIYHASGAEIDWLHNQAAELEALAKVSIGRRRIRFQHNSRALHQYAQHFGTRNFKILDDESFNLVLDDVIVSVYPDLHVVEGKFEKYIKLEFTTNQLSKDYIAIVSQALFEAINTAGRKIPASCILLLDVSQGVEYRGARMRARMRSEIIAACQNISAIWDAI